MSLKRQFQLAGYETSFARVVPALMGRKDSATPTYTYDAPGGQGYKYVRLGDGSSSSLTVAFNRAGVADTGDLKVWIAKDFDTRWIIIGTRY